MSDLENRMGEMFLRIWFVAVVAIIIVAVIFSAENPENVIVISIVLLGVVAWVVVQVDKALGVFRAWLNGDVGTARMTVVHLKMGEIIINNNFTDDNPPGNEK